MKTIFRLFTLALLAISFTACLEERCDAELEYIEYQPVIVDPQEFRAMPIEAEAARELCHPAGFYVYGNYLFIIEHGEGLHILDNADPRAPSNLSFIPVDGAVGLAARNGILYVNQHIDLLAFDISNPAQPSLVGRTENVFEPYTTFTSGLNAGSMVVNYVPTNTRIRVNCNENRGNRFFQDDVLFLEAGFVAGMAINTAQNTFDSQPRASEVLVGIGGSLARFTISQGNLYAVDESKLKTFNLGNPRQPEFMGNVQLNWNVETIFPHGEELYIGTSSGMHIVSVADPLNPVHLSSLEHVQACDPVVVNGTKAYVTLRGGGWCGGFSNQLEIVDVSDPRRPNRLQVYPMNGPAGLSVSQDKLFICEPGFGLQVYALESDGLRGRLLVSDTQLREANDVIGLHNENRLITIGADGINQLTYDNNGALSPLSHLDICDEI